MTAKRFTIGDRTLQEVYECCIPAILDGGIPCTQSQVLKLLNELHEENKQLKEAIAETEKIVQSTYDELTKLRCFKKNILRIKHNWDYLMEAIQYG